MTVKTDRALVLTAVFLIKVYRILFGFLPHRCRFYPSCSEYARQSFEKSGFFKGLFLTARRILKCHPFNPGGVDLPQD